MASKNIVVKTALVAQKFLNVSGATHWQGAGRSRVYFNDLEQFNLGRIAYGDVYYETHVGLVFNAAKSERLAKKAAAAIEAAATATA